MRTMSRESQQISTNNKDKHKRKHQTQEGGIKSQPTNDPAGEGKLVRKMVPQAVEDGNEARDVVQSHG